MWSHLVRTVALSKRPPHNRPMWNSAPSADDGGHTRGAVQSGLRTPDWLSVPMKDRL